MAAEMDKKVRLPDWHFNRLLAAFAVDATILVESVCLIFGGFENTSPLAISLLTNGFAVIIAGYGGHQALPAAFLCICLTSVFLLYGIVTTFGTQGTYGQGYDGTYAILCSVAHLHYTSLSIYQQMESQRDPNLGQEIEKKDDCVTQNETGESLDDSSDSTVSERAFVAFQFGDAFRMQAGDFTLFALGTMMVFRVLDWDTGFGIVFASCSGLLSAVLLYFIDSTRLQDEKVDVSKAYKRFWVALVSMGVFCYVLSSNAEMPAEFSWWRLAFTLTWFPWMFHTLLLYVKSMTRPTWLGGNSDAALPGNASQSANTISDVSGQIDPKLASEGTQNASTFYFRWRKDPDTIERHWLNGQPWIQMSPRTFVLLLVSSFILLSFGPLEYSKVAAFYLLLAITLACRGHSPVADTPELMFAHVKHSFVDWITAVGALATTAATHLILQNPSIEVLSSFGAPIGCVWMARLLLPVFTSVADTKDDECRIEHVANTTENDDIEGQISETSGGKSNLDSTLVYFSPRIRRFDLRILTMGLSITILDFILNDELTGWPKTCQVSSFTTIIMLILDTSVPQDRELGFISFYILTVGLFACFNHFNFLNIFFLFGNDIHDNGDHSFPVKAAIFFALFGMMIFNNRNVVRRQEEHVLPAQTDKQPMSNSLLINVDISRFGVNCGWQLRNAQVCVVLILALISGYTDEEWPLPLNTTAASLGIFILIMGFQTKPRRLQEDKISVTHLSALGICTVATVMAAILQQHGVFESLRYTQWQVVTCTGFVFYCLAIAWISRLVRLFSSLRDRQAEPGSDGGEIQQDSKSRKEDRGFLTEKPGPTSPVEKSDVAIESKYEPCPS